MLQPTGLSLRGQNDVDGFVAAFTGSHRFVLDYLAEEVLERQSDQVREFLLETSVLEQVERAGLFLVPLDDMRGWWRYHHLFADLLGVRLEQEQHCDELFHLRGEGATVQRCRDASLRILQRIQASAP